MNDIFDEIGVENADAVRADLNLSVDDCTADRIRKNVLKNMKKTDKSRKIFFTRLTAVAAALCVVLTSAAAVHYHSRQGGGAVSDNTNVITQAEQKRSFSIMQVYADDTAVEVQKQPIDVKTPFFQIIRSYGTWQQADDLINEQKKSHNNYIYYEYYPVGDYDDARESSGYIIAKLYGNYFDIKGENIVSVNMTAQHGWISCFFSENHAFENDYLEMNKSGNNFGGRSISLDKETLARQHKIMWNTGDGEEMWDLFTSEDFKYSDLNDTMTITVTTENNGVKNTERVIVDITFDEEGIMHTTLK